MTEKEQLLALFKKMGIKRHKIFNETQFICEDAVKLGAVESVSICDFELNFNKRGRLIGTSASWIKSFVPRNKKK